MNTIEGADDREGQLFGGASCEKRDPTAGCEAEELRRSTLEHHRGIELADARYSAKASTNVVGLHCLK